jgi:hypothetical protein
MSSWIIVVQAGVLEQRRQGGAARKIACMSNVQKHAIETLECQSFRLGHEKHHLIGEVTCMVSSRAELYQNGGEQLSNMAFFGIATTLLLTRDESNDKERIGLCLLHCARWTYTEEVRCRQ